METGHIFEARCAWKSPFESRYAWKKVKGDCDYDGPQKLANRSLMWEKRVAYR